MPYQFYGRMYDLCGRFKLKFINREISDEYFLRDVIGSAGVNNDNFPRIFIFDSENSLREETKSAIISEAEKALSTNLISWVPVMFNLALR